jgi:hypothetical protein
MYTEDIHNVLNCHNVANYWRSDAHGTEATNTASAISHAVNQDGYFHRCRESARCKFGSKKRSVLHKSKEISHSVSQGAFQ